MIESVSFGAVRARMVASVVWLVADVLILTVWAVAKAVMTDNRWQMADGRWLELLGSRWLVGGTGTTLRGVRQGRE